MSIHLNKQFNKYFQDFKKLFTIFHFILSMFFFYYFNLPTYLVLLVAINIEL